MGPAGRPGRLWEQEAVGQQTADGHVELAGRLRVPSRETGDLWMAATSGRVSTISSGSIAGQRVAR